MIMHPIYRTILLFSFLSFPMFLIGQSAQKTYQASRITSSPKIDGVLNDACWQNLPIAGDFVQYEPFVGKASSQRTEVKLAYDNKAMYVSAFMYDNHADSIMAELSERDNADGNTDIFAFTVLPFNDGLNGFSFWITAAGVQADFKNINGDSDNSWNAVWESGVKRVENGWIAEFKIPYSALRFPKVDQHVWGINFWRSIRREREWSTWNLVDKNKGAVLPQSGVVNGIKDIAPPLRLSATPYVSTYIENHSADNKTSYSINGGLDLKYGINESFTLDMTLIPDFGQVQSDDVVLNLSPYETYYDEKRSFFTEGTELFDKCDIFYSRRIGSEPVGYSAVSDLSDEIIKNPNKTKLINATKVSGRTNKGLGIGFFNAMSAESTATLKDSAGIEYDIISQPFTNYNMLVIDQTLKNNSYVSLVNTNVSRFKDDYTANVTGTEFALINKKNSYGIKGKGVLSQHYIAQDTDLGFNYELSFEKLSGNFLFEIQRTVISDTYNPNDLGYLSRNNFSDNTLVLTYKQYEPKGFVLRGDVDWWLSHQSLYQPNNFLSLEMGVNSQITYKNYMSTFFNFNQSLSHFNDFFESRNGSIYKKPANTFVSLFLSPDYRNRFLVDLGASYGFSTEFHNRKSVYDYDFTIAPRFRVNNKMNLVYKFNFDEVAKEYGFVEQNESLNAVVFGERNVRTVTNTISTAYIFNNVSSLTFRLRHYWSTADYSSFYTLNKEGYLDPVALNENHNINFNAFTIDMAYKWQFAPGSEISIVWKNNINSWGNSIIGSYVKNLEDILSAPQINSISVKVLYYLDYQYLKRS